MENTKIKHFSLFWGGVLIKSAYIIDPLKYLNINELN